MSAPDLAARQRRQVIRARARFDCALNDYRLDPGFITKTVLIAATHSLHELEPWASGVDDVLSALFAGEVA